MTRGLLGLHTRYLQVPTLLPQQPLRTRPPPCIPVHSRLTFDHRCDVALTACVCAQAAQVGKQCTYITTDAAQHHALQLLRHASCTLHTYQVHNRAHVLSTHLIPCPGCTALPRPLVPQSVSHCTSHSLHPVYHMQRLHGTTYAIGHAVHWNAAGNTQACIGSPSSAVVADRCVTSCCCTTAAHVDQMMRCCLQSSGRHSLHSILSCHHYGAGALARLRSHVQCQKRHVDICNASSACSTARGACSAICSALCTAMGTFCAIVRPWLRNMRGSRCARCTHRSR